MRKRRLVIGASTAVLLAGTGAAIAVTAGSASAATGYGVAPYVDLTASSATMLNSAVTSGGLGAFTAAFVIGSGCNPIWGDTLGPANSTVNPFIDNARSKGAKMIVSFGGAGGVELAQSCTDTKALTAAYQSVITHYAIDHVDFDIEGAAIADQGSIDRRFAAIKALEAANSGLNVSVTIPVLENGPDANGGNFLKSAKRDGVTLSIVNAMTMDYGHSVANMAAAAQTAAAGTLASAKSAGFTGMTYANIGITPMIGNNDSAGEVVSEANARTIVSWARSNGIGRLAFWSLGRDQPCAGGGVSPNCSGLGGSALDFTKIFSGGSSGGGGPTPTTGPTTARPTTKAPTASPTTTKPGTAAPWVANHAYKIGDLVSYAGKNYRCIQAHTSLQGWEPPIVPALWQPV